MRRYDASCPHGRDVGPARGWPHPSARQFIGRSKPPPRPSPEPQSYHWHVEQAARLRGLQEHRDAYGHWPGASCDAACAERMVA